MRVSLCALVLLFGCDAPFVEYDTRVLVEPQRGYWELPLPFELREGGLDENASETDSELLEAARATLNGSWSDGAIVLPITGDIDPTTLPEDSLDRDATVYLTTLDDVPSRVPVTVELLPADGARPRLLLVRLHGAVPQPETRYALVVTDFLRDENNSRIRRSRSFNDAWEGNDGADPELRELVLELRAALVRDRVELQPIAGAAVFETDAGVRP